MDDFTTILARPSTARNAPSLGTHRIAQAIMQVEAAKEQARFLGRHVDADAYIDFRDYLAGILHRALRAEAGEGRGR